MYHACHARPEQRMALDKGGGRTKGFVRSRGGKLADGNRGATLAVFLVFIAGTRRLLRPFFWPFLPTRFWKREEIEVFIDGGNGNPDKQISSSVRTPLYLTASSPHPPVTVTLPPSPPAHPTRAVGQGTSYVLSYNSTLSSPPREEETLFTAIIPTKTHQRRNRRNPLPPLLAFPSSKKHTGPPSPHLPSRKSRARENKPPFR